MSAKKPPPRPPLPRTTTARSGQPTGAAPERSLRNPFASISIRYSSSNKESDSDEEISIVRKQNSPVPVQNEKTEEIGGEDKEDGFYKVTRRACEQVENANTSRPEKNKHAEGTSATKHNSSATGLKDSIKSHSTQELRQSPEKRSAVTKQSTWPNYSRTEDSERDSSVIMKFLRGREREREQANETNAESSKEGVCLSEKDESDAGSLPSKNHVDDGSEHKLKAGQQRSRSPSPFRLLNRDRQDESASTGDQEKPKSSAGISLSSLLASIAKDEAHGETEDKLSDSGESESNAEIISEIPSPDSSINLCHFDEAGRETGTRFSSRPTVDKSPKFSNFCLCCLLVYIYFTTTFPPFVSGLVLGSLFAYLGGCAFLWLFCPEDTLSERYEKELLEYEERLARTPKPDYRSVDPGLLQKKNILKASTVFSFKL